MNSTAASIGDKQISYYYEPKGVNERRWGCYVGGIVYHAEGFSLLSQVEGSRDDVRRVIASSWIRWASLFYNNQREEEDML
jgi:hypothetical protein